MNWENLDFTTLAGWLALLAFLIVTKWNDIRSGLGKLYKDQQADAVAERESQADIEQAELEGALQHRATEIAISARTAEEAFSLVREVVNFSQEEFSEVVKGVELNTRELIEIKNKLQMIIMILDAMRERR